MAKLSLRRILIKNTGFQAFAHVVSLGIGLVTLIVAPENWTKKEPYVRYNQAH